MATIVEVTNPFEPVKSREIHQTDHETIRGWLDDHYSPGYEFPIPTVCFLNGKAAMRADWLIKKIGPGDHVEFIAQAQDPITTIIAIVIAAAAAAAAIALTPSIPTIPSLSDIPEGDPAYTLRGHRNQARPGDPIEVPYGKNRIWPSYASRPYNRYEDNDQYLYSLFCVGQGEYDIPAATVKIGDTAIANYADTTYTEYPPGSNVDLFPDSVTSVAAVAGGLELEGPNEVTDPIVGPFVVNTVGEGETTTLEIDYSLPVGLYYSNNDGGLTNRTATVKFEYREIEGDGTGTPVTGASWVAFNAGGGGQYTHTLATVHPQRFTVSESVSSGFYQVRAQRVNNADTSHRTGDTIRWDGLKCLHPDTRNYGEVTLIAVRAKANNNLNDQSRSSFNIVATRKVPTWSPGGGWAAISADRSWVWAFCDVLRSEYGPQIADSLIDLQGLYDLRNTGDFDWVFDQRTNVWEALRIIARARRGTPVMNGSQVSVVRDVSGSTPTAVFNRENIHKNSLQIHSTLYTQEEYDGVELEFIDPNNGTKEIQTYVLPELVSSDQKLQRLTIPGLNGATDCYREASFIVRSKQYLREQVSFVTGMEGLIPQYGDLIAIAHELPRWGQGGMIKSLTLVGFATYEVEFDKIPDVPTGSPYLAMRKKDGTMSAVYAATATTDPTKFTFLMLGGDVLADFETGDNVERAYWLFGEQTTYSKLCRVRRAAPNGIDSIQITAVVYSDEPYANDSGSPSAGPSPLLQEIPDLPTVAGLLVRDYPGKINRALATWEPAAGATGYVVQESTDNTNWTIVGQTQEKFFEWRINDGPLYVRVAGINLGQGTWATWNGTLGGNNNLNPVIDIPPDIDLGDLDTA